MKLTTLLLYLLTILLALPAPSATAETVYKTVSADGSIAYSDQPPAPGTANTETIELSGANTYQNTSTRVAYEPKPVVPANAGSRYSYLGITSPEHDANFRDNAGNVVIGTSVSPALIPGDRLLLQLDGKLTQMQPDDNQILLSNVARGTHRIKLVIVNQQGQHLIESNEQQFHLQRVSVQSPNAAGSRRPPGSGNRGG
jgi:hypothetical protein